MKICYGLFLALLSSAFAQSPIINTNIDMSGFLAIAWDAAVHRQNRRLTEEQFIQFSREPGTVILDARSRAMFDLLHVKGAINLNFSDITVDSLAKKFPSKAQRILIYCNNNFLNAPRAFESKAPGASLNLSTFSTLYGYGYTNVYELGPLLDVKTTRIELVPTEVSKADRR